MSQRERAKGRVACARCPRRSGGMTIVKVGELWLCAMCVAAALKQAERELSTVDEALARRAALDALPDRYSKIMEACCIAGRAEGAEAQLTRVRECVRVYPSGSVVIHPATEAGITAFWDAIRALAEPAAGDDDTPMDLSPEERARIAKRHRGSDGQSTHIEAISAQAADNITKREPASDAAPLSSASGGGALREALERVDAAYKAWEACDDPDTFAAFYHRMGAYDLVQAALAARVPLDADRLRAIAKQALHCADVVWRSETDGALDFNRLRDLQEKYVAAAIATLQARPSAVHISPTQETP